jgi:hypothetical protein
MAKGGMLNYEGKKAKVISKKKDDKGNVMYFVEVENYYPNGDTLRTILRDSDFDKMAKGGITYEQLKPISNEIGLDYIFSKRFQGAKNKDGDEATGLIIFDDGKNNFGEFVYKDKNGQEYQSKEIPYFTIDFSNMKYYGKMAKGGYMADGGEIRWQDVNRGDSALVVAENKMGVIVQTYGRRFHLKFPDGTDKTYFAEELKFFKDEDEYAKGGKIKNQYDGRNPQDIWDNLSKEQRAHFIYDHKEEIEEYRGNNFGELTNQEIKEAYNSSYDELDENIKSRFDNHTREGQYAKGGLAEGEWVVYVGNDQKIIGTYKSNRAAKMALDKLWESGQYESAGIGAKSEAYSEEYFAKGGYMEDGGYVVYDKYFNDQGKLRVRIIGKYKNRLAAKKNSRGEDGVGYSFTDMDTFNEMYDAKMIDDNKMANGGRLGDSTYLVQMAEQYAEKEYGKKVKKGQGVAKAQKVGDAYDYSQVTIFFEDGSQETFEREDFEEFFELED